MAQVQPSPEHGWAEPRLTGSGGGVIAVAAEWNGAGILCRQNDQRRARPMTAGSDSHLVGRRRVRCTPARAVDACGSCHANHAMRLMSGWQLSNGHLLLTAAALCEAQTVRCQRTASASVSVGLMISSLQFMRHSPRLILQSRTSAAVVVVVVTPSFSACLAAAMYTEHSV
jgi:hypothetical protein